MDVCIIALLRKELFPQPSLDNEMLDVGSGYLVTYVSMFLDRT